MMFVRRESTLGPGPSPPTMNPEADKAVPLYNQRSSLLALTISFMVFSWVCSLLRLHTRFFILRSPGWDDFFIVLTMLSTTAGSIVLCILPNLGLGKPASTMTYPQLKEFMRVMYVGSVTYPLSVTFIKLALLCQYLRVLNCGWRYKILCRFMIVISVLWGLAFAILTFIPCWPVVAYWDFSIRDARCWGLGSRDLSDFMNFFVGQAITASVLDIIIFVIPIPLYFKPDTLRKTRIALLALSTLGLSVILCSMWRMAVIVQMYQAGKGGVFDPTWYSATVGGLACIEVHLATVCAALPVFWPVLKSWNRIFVTQTVSVTSEHGVFRSKAGDVELKSISSSRNLKEDAAVMPESWEPFVGDETTGLGENETVIKSPATAHRTRLGRVFSSNRWTSRTP